MKKGTHAYFIDIVDIVLDYMTELLSSACSVLASANSWGLTDHVFVEELLYPQLQYQCSVIIATLYEGKAHYTTCRRVNSDPELSVEDPTYVDSRLQNFKIDKDSLKNIGINVIETY